MRILILGPDADRARRCAESLSEGHPNHLDWRWAPDLHDHREKAINAALRRLRDEGYDGDVLLVGDDIEGTPGWYAALMAHYETADILGMCTANPISHVIRDAGFDLVERDGRVTLEPYLMGTAEWTPPRFRFCHAVCGCFMLVKKRVLDVVTRMEERELYGGGRWGEATYQLWAQREGFKVGVIGHVVGHYGESTKGERSISAIEERAIWQRVVDAGYCTHIAPRHEPATTLSTGLQEWLSTPDRHTVIWGTGTIAEPLLAAADEDHTITIVSGLADEWGRVHFNHLVMRVDDVAWDDVDRLLITVRGMARVAIAEAMAQETGAPAPEVVTRKGGVLDV